ncbi:MAG: hypothetical protein KBD66_02785 [Candidatus Doudnabacteria bacterium]|nr:hypothetical protein [Candidatus Doudnabacteria bacterium]
MKKVIVVFSMALLAIGCNSAKPLVQQSSPEQIAEKPATVPVLSEAKLQKGTDAYRKAKIAEYIATEACKSQWSFADCKLAGKVAVYAPGDKITKTSKPLEVWGINFNDSILSAERSMVGQFMYNTFQKPVEAIIMSDRTATEKKNYTAGVFNLYLEGKLFNLDTVPYKYNLTANTTDWKVCKNTAAGYEVLIPADFRPWKEKTNLYADPVVTTCPLSEKQVYFAPISAGGGTEQGVLQVSFDTGFESKKYSTLDDYIFTKVTNKPEELTAFALDGQPAYWYIASNGTNYPTVITLLGGFPVKIVREGVTDAMSNSFILSFKRMQ